MKKVLFIHPEGNITGNPTLESIITSLINHGIGVSLIKRYRPQTEKQVIDGVTQYVDSRWLWYLKSFVVNKMSTLFLARLIAFVFSRRYGTGYDLIIGIDRQGLIESRCLANVWKVPYAHISFEIMFEDETSKRYKELERWAIRDVKFIVIQDSERAELFNYENKCLNTEMLLIPIASTGAALMRSNKRLRDIIGIPQEKKVIIFIGTLASWSMITEVLSVTHKLPPDWVLLVHDRYGMTSKKLDNIYPDWRELSGERVYVNDLASIDMKGMASVLAGVDYGLAFYQADAKSKYTGKNIKHIGMASGKIATYLFHGVPVITNIEGEMSNLINRHKLGVIIENPDDIISLLETYGAMRNYEEIQSFYKKRLDFSLYENIFVDKCLAVMRQ